ncbi:MAG: hypothetical protein K0R19_968 [Bacillota bacterium]|nr:hypothetical protein [Bacillota bacterium]
MVKINDFNPECITYSQMDMIFYARLYYRRILALTRSYMRNRYYSLGAVDVLFDRLYLESLDIGRLLQLNFGRARSETYSQYLSQFVIYLRDLISAQIEGNTEGINQNVQNLYDNINTRAAFLAAMNPYWSEAEYKTLLGTYVQGLIELANAYSSGNLNEVITIYDNLTEQTNNLGDAFAEGIYNYITSGSSIPASGPCITYEQMRRIQNIRMFWFDLMVWLRTYMIDKLLKLGNEDAVYNRIKKVIADYTNELKSIFGEKLGEDLAQYLYEYLELVDNYLNAQMAGNIDEINRIIPLLYQNAASRAALQASVNPLLSEEEWRNRLSNLQVRGIIDETTAILSGDIARSLDIFIDLLNQAESMSDYFAKTLFNYFIQIQKNQ